jgi:hypothetical protein
MYIYDYLKNNWDDLSKIGGKSLLSAEILHGSVEEDPRLRSVFMLAVRCDLFFFFTLFDKNCLGCKIAPLIFRAWRNIGFLYDTQLRV